MKTIRKALDWAKSIQQFAPISDHHRRAVSELWPWIEPLDVQTALEVGTGQPPGIVVQMLRDHGVTAVGLDGQAGSDYQGDMHDLPFDDKSFDLVVSRHSLEHVLIPYVCLFEMCRVSRKWLLCIVPTDVPKFVNWPDHLHGYSQLGWEMMFRKCGLTIEHFEVGDFTEGYALRDGLWRDEELRYLLRKGE